MFFSSFVIIGVFVFLNILLGIFFSNFTTNPKQENSEIIEKWFEIQKKILNAEPFSYKLPKTHLKLKFLSFFSSKFYKRMILIVIVFNFLLLSLKFDTASPKLLQVIQTGSLFLTLLYGLEVFCKIYCYGFSTGYILNNKSRLELVIFSIYVLDFTIYMMASEEPSLFDSKPQRILNALKFLSLVRFLNIIKSLKYLIRTFWFSLPLLLNLLFLMLISFFIYGNLGVYFYHRIDSGSILNSRLNFSNIFNGFMVLFKCLTCDNWGDIMFDCIDGEKKILPEGKHFFYYFFFIFFYFFFYFFLIFFFFLLIFF